MRADGTPFHSFTATTCPDASFRTSGRRLDHAGRNRLVPLVLSPQSLKTCSVFFFFFRKRQLTQSQGRHGAPTVPPEPSVSKTEMNSTYALGTLRRSNGHSRVPRFVSFSFVLDAQKQELHDNTGTAYQRPRQPHTGSIELTASVA